MPDTMERTCVICTAAGGWPGTAPVHDLVEVGNAPAAGAHLGLCREHLEARTERRWDRNDEDLDRLRQALTDRDVPPRGSYLYLVTQDEEIHLVRLQAAWMEGHASAARDPA